MENYEALEKLFMDAVNANNEGDQQTATTLFKEILKVEPRMAEPRLELAVIYLRQNMLETAESYAREAVSYLERGWRWLDNLTDEQILGHAYNTLGEILKARSTTDEILSQGTETIKQYWEEAGDLFEKAAELDSENADIMSNYYGFKKQKMPRPAR